MSAWITSHDGSNHEWPKKFKGKTFDEELTWETTFLLKWSLKSPRRKRDVAVTAAGATMPMLTRVSRSSFQSLLEREEGERLTSRSSQALTDITSDDWITRTERPIPGFTDTTFDASFGSVKLTTGSSLLTSQSIDSGRNKMTRRKQNCPTKTECEYNTVLFLFDTPVMCLMLEEFLVSFLTFLLNSENRRPCYFVIL
jgi:hypothetical protein